MADYDEQIFLARVAEQADRFEDMVDHLEKAVQLKNDDLNSEERNLLSVGFKNLIGSRRSALRSIGGIEQNTKYAHFADGLTSYKVKIENELYDQCMRVINLIEDNIIQNCKEQQESKAFFYKLIGDYFRYIAESAHEERLNDVKEKAREYYDKATDAANSLPKHNPIRMGLALNFSVFYFEVTDNKEEAIKVAQGALQNAEESLEDADEDTYRDAKGIIDLLTENLELWKEEDGGKD